ncbi:MAG TPA: four helix bundle protein [Acidobacteriaceae bacterium]
MRVRQFRDLQVWQKAMALARDIYLVSQTFPRAEQFGLTSQMRRAAVSVPSNIAEGQGQLSDKGFILFLSHARGSLYELETQAELAESLAFMTRTDLDRISSQCREVGKMLHGLINSMREEKREG